MTALRIGFVCPEYPPAAHGGIGVFTKGLAEAMVREGHRVHVLAVGQRRERVRQNGVFVDRVPDSRMDRFPRLSLLANQWMFSRAVRDWAIAHRLDVIEFPDWKGPGAYIQLPRRLPMPAIVRLHGSTTAYALMSGRRVSRLVRHLEKAGLASADYRIAVGSRIDKHTTKAFSLRSGSDAIVENFLSPRFLETPQRLDRKDILFIGRITRNKGIDILFRELPLILENRPDVNVTLAGPDSNEGRGGGSYLEELLSELPERFLHRVVHRGWVKLAELPRLYASVLCTVLPSVAEAFALVGIESMSCETPVVVPRESSLGDYVRDGETGLLFNRGIPGDLAGCVIHLLDDTTLRTRIGMRARQCAVERFGLESILPGNLDIYDRLVVEGRQRA